MGTVWWAEDNCPKCGKVLSVQAWGRPHFRMTCTCGFSALSYSPLKLQVVSDGDSFGQEGT